MNNSLPILLVTMHEGQIVQVWMHPYVYSQATVVIADLDSPQVPRIHHQVSVLRMSEAVQEVLSRMAQEEESESHGAFHPEEKPEVISV